MNAGISLIIILIVDRGSHRPSSFWASRGEGPTGADNRWCSGSSAEPTWAEIYTHEDQEKGHKRRRRIHSRTIDIFLRCFRSAYMLSFCLPAKPLALSIQSSITIHSHIHGKTQPESTVFIISLFDSPKSFKLYQIYVLQEGLTKLHTGSRKDQL